MKSYCFLSHVPASDGQAPVPESPDGTECLLLADLPELGWGIYDVTHDESWSPASPVSDELAGLIESGKRYPPALGLARQEVGEVFGDHRPSQLELARAHGTALRVHLSRQHEAPYVVAPALKKDTGYLEVGEGYWVLDVSGRPAVASWVSDDFHIYSDDVNVFDLTGQQLKRLGYVG